MTVKRALLLIVLGATSIFLAGCSSRENEIFGTWKNKDEDMTMTFNKDFTITGKEGTRITTGKWFLQGNRVKITDVAIDGKPITEMLKQQIAAIHSSHDPHKEYQLEQSLNPTLVLSDDGKTLAADEEVNGRMQTLIRLDPGK